MLEKYLIIHPEVQKSLSSGEPVVALESTTIYNDIPYPQNIEIANNICKIIRNNGAVPATLAIIDGVLRAGLTEEEIELLATNKNIISANKKNLPFVISKKLTSLSDINTAIILANLAGIKIISTGILKTTGSLRELSNTEIAVVCDKIESLDTPNITIVEYELDNIPTITSTKCDFKANNSMEIANALKVKLDLNLKGGMLVHNSNSKFFKKNIKTINPNIQIMYNNAKLSAEIAKDLCHIYKSKY